jgi:hypothetical protein
MRLTLEHLHLYLLDKGFIEPASVVSGDYLATQMHTRNLIFQVTRRHAPSLFVKQLHSFDASNTYVLQKDATCLWLIKNHPAFAELSTYVPGYFGFDPGKQVLVTEYLPAASNLEDYARLRQGQLPEALRERIAALLASYHFALGPEVLLSRSVRFFPRQVPWVLALADADPAAPPHLFSSTNTPNPVGGAVLGSPAFREALASIRAEWVATTLIHGDVKWMNLLVHPEDGEEQVKLIDWEIADIGDPLWDVAGVFQSLVCSALFYSPALGGAELGLVPGVGLADLRAAWPQLEHFWLAYRARTAPDAEPGGTDLARALRYTGARLVQSAIEQNALFPTLQPNTIKILQASYAMLTGLPALLSYFPATQAAELV